MLNGLVSGRMVVRIVKLLMPMMTVFASLSPLQTPAEPSINELTINERVYRIPTGFTLKRVAGPELVPRPIVADLALDGRLYVADSSGTNDDVQTQLREKPHRLLCLIDDDGDGAYDRRQVFADHLMFPEGVLCHQGSVFVSAPPEIWRLTDTTGDGQADLREIWFDAKTLTGCANDLHGPYLGHDGWIYWCKGAFAEQTYQKSNGETWKTRAAHIFRRKPSGGPVEPVMTGGMDNPVEVVFTPAGERIFTTTFFQHPGGGQRDGLIHAIYGGVYGKVHGVLDGHLRTRQGTMPVLTHLGAAAPCGLACLAANELGQEWKNNLISTAFNLHQVIRHELVPKGATFRTQDTPIVDTDDLDFHPTDVLEDADGSLLIVDTGGWYKLCCPTSQLHKPDVLGGIYRFSRRDAAPIDDPYGQQIRWTAKPSSLVAHLDDPRSFVRRQAIEALSASGLAVIPSLSAAIRANSSVRLRQQAIWTLTRIAGAEARTAVHPALDDPTPAIRQTALHSIAVHRDATALPLVLPKLSDPIPSVRRVAAEAIGRIGEASAVADLLGRCSTESDEIVRHSLIYAVIEIGDLKAIQLTDLTRPDGLAAALIARDQFADPSLDANEVVPALTNTNDSLAAAAMWLVARHPDWSYSVIKQVEDLISQAPNKSLPVALYKATCSVAVDPTARTSLAALLNTTNEPAARETVAQLLAEAPAGELTDIAQNHFAIALSDDNRQSDRVHRLLLEALSKVEQPLTNDQLIARLRRMATNPQRSTSDRLLASTSLHRTNIELSDPQYRWLLSKITDENNDQDRRMAAAAIAGAHLTAPQLHELIEQFETFGPIELGRLLSALGRAQNVELVRFGAGKLATAPTFAVLSEELVRDIFKGFPELKTEIDQLLAGRKTTTQDQAAKLEEVFLRTTQGDVRRGQAVFHSAKAACFSCHQMGYRGGTAGPDLTRIGKIRSRRDLLEAVLFPNASFVRSYEPMVVTTKDGRIFQGVVKDETSRHLILVDAQRQTREIPVAEIENRSPSTVSIMPSGLDQLISDRDLADLLSFLESSR